MVRSVRLFRIALFALPLLVLSACDSNGDEPTRIGLSGRWIGDLVNTQDMSQIFPVDMTLTDDTNNIVGTGTVVLPNETLAFSVTRGQFSGGFVNLELVFDRPPQGSLSGNVTGDDDTITGTMSGPNLVNGEVELMLRRAD